MDWKILKTVVRLAAILATPSVSAPSVLAQTPLANSYLTSLDVSSNTTLSPAANFPSFMVGPLTGSSTLTIAGGFTQTTGVNGIVSFTNNGAFNTFSGNIIADSGTFRVSGSPFASNGGFTASSMTASNTITVNRAGFLTIDDFATGTGGYTANRFGSVGQRPDVNLAGGTITLSGLNNASSSVQTFGALTSSSGQGTVNVTRNSNGTPTLTFASLAINSGSFLTFNGTNLGTGTSDSRITFTSSPTLNDGILAGARFYSGAAGTSGFVTYGANGIREFTASDFTVYGANDINAASSTENVQMTGAGAPVALSGHVTVNSLNYNGQGGTWSLGGNTLTIDSGMLLRNGTNAAVTIDTGTLTAGNGIDDIDLNVIVAQQNMTINAVIADNASSAVTLVKSGDGRSLTLSGGASNTYTGGTFVLGGTLTTGGTANRRYLGTGKATADGESVLTLAQVGATSFSGSLVDPTFIATNGARIAISNNNHGATEFFNIGPNSLISGASGSGTGLASLTRGTNITLASGAIISHGQQTAALNLTTGTIQNIGTSADLFYGLNGNQNSATGAITIGNGTAFRGISTDRSDRSWEQGTINIASGTTSVDFQGHAGLQNAVQLTLGNGGTAGNPVIASAVTGTVDIRAIGRVQLNDSTAVYGDTGAGQNVRFVATPGSTLTVTSATGMGSGTGIASALVQNGGILAIGNAAALNGAVTVQSGGQFNANQASGLTGTGALTFNEGSIVLIGNATGFSDTQATSATINPGTFFRLATGNFGTAGTTLDSILGSGSNHVSFISVSNNPVNPTNPNTAVYTLNKSAGGIGGVLTDDGAGPTSNPNFTNNNRTVGSTTNGNITLGANGGVIAATTNAVFTISENITGAGSLTIGTTAILAGMPKLGTVALNTANDYTGGTIVNAGTLQLGNAAALGSTSGQLTVNAGTTLNMNNNNLTIGNLSGTGGTISSGTSGTRTLTIGEGDFGGGNYQGSIQNGSGATTALTKTGTGTITLSGNNTYTGATAINAGTLRVNGSLGLSTVTVGALGTLSGNGTLAGALTVNGSLAPGNSIGTLTTGSDVTWNGSVATPWIFELGSGNTADLLDINGGSSDFLRGSGTVGIDFVFDFAGSTAVGTFDLVTWDGTTTFLETDFVATNLGGGNTGNFSITGNTLQFVVVPEPTTLALAACGLAGLGIAGGRRFRRKG